MYRTHQWRLLGRQRETESIQINTSFTLKAANTCPCAFGLQFCYKTEERFYVKGPLLQQKDEICIIIDDLHTVLAMYAK